MTTDFETFVRESLSKMDERFDKTATKADLAKLATKADLAGVEKRLTTAIKGLGKAFMDSTGRVRDDELVDA